MNAPTMQRPRAPRALPWPIAAALLMSACAGGSTVAPPPQPAPTSTHAATAEPPAAEPPPAVRQAPPAPGTPRDVKFPPIARAVAKGGLEVNAVKLGQLPTVDIKLVIRSGSADDPSRFQGMAHLVASMLKEGTLRRSSAQIAEEVDFLGAHLWVSNDEETVTIQMRALSEHLQEALSLVADLAVRPKFSDKELAKLKKREFDRLALQVKEPYYLAPREFFGRLYGEHPYAHIDTTAEVVKRVRSSDLKRWHRQHFAPNNAFLVVVGDAEPEAVTTAAGKAFKGWYKRRVPKTKYAAPPVREKRSVVIVDRPESVQSVIFVGNLAISRNSPDYIPLAVANQVLGGSAASRLFMDLREKQSLTYGAYSRIYESVEQAPFRAYAAVRNEVTAQAMRGFMDHLTRIAAEPAPDAELANAKRFLSDRFPLQIDTPAKIADLVAELRQYGLPDTYWDSYRSEIAKVDAGQALAAAKAHIRANEALIVVVGKAAAIKDALTEYGDVVVIDVEGTPIVDAPKTQSKAKGAAQPEASAKSSAAK